jgi:predicted small lipoprotein YifL
MKRAALLPALVVALATGGCGQKGPLYLPDKNAKVATAPAASATPATPAGAQPAAPAPTPATAPKPNDKDQDTQPPK